MKAEKAKAPEGRLAKLREAGKAPRKETPRLVRVASSTLFDAAEASVEQLVETIEACKAELLSRQEQLGNQLNVISKALGEAA